MSKTNAEIELQRQNDLLEAYKAAIKTSCSSTEACEKAVKMPAPRYYVTPKQAYQVVMHMMKGDFELVDMMQSNRRRMYYSLFDKVVELSEKRAFVNKSLWYIMPFAVTCSAPEFFTSISSLARVRQGIKSGKIGDDGRRVAPLTEKEIRKSEAAREERMKLREYRMMRKRMKGELV